MPTKGFLIAFLRKKYPGHRAWAANEGPNLTVYTAIMGPNMDRKQPQRVVEGLQLRLRRVNAEAKVTLRRKLALTRDKKVIPGAVWCFGLNPQAKDAMESLGRHVQVGLNHYNFRKKGTTGKKNPEPNEDSDEEELETEVLAQELRTMELQQIDAEAQAEAAAAFNGE